MNKQQEFRKQTEEAKLEAFSLMCKKVAELEKENAELQHKVDILQGFLDRDVEFDNLQKENAEIKEELKKWKDEWQEQVQKATDEGYARTLQTIQLTKAKFLLKQLVDAFPKSYSDVVKDTLDEAEQFLNEVEKCGQ